MERVNQNKNFNGFKEEKSIFSMTTYEKKKNYFHQHSTVPIQNLAPRVGKLKIQQGFQLDEISVFF